MPEGVRNALREHAKIKDISESEAALDLIVQGLKVPDWYGVPRTRHDALDDILDGVVPAVMVRERKMIAEKAKAIRAEPVVEPWPETVPMPSVVGPLPVLGYDDVTTILSTRARESRTIAKEQAKAGAFDEVMDGLDLIAENDVAASRESSPEVMRADSPPAAVTSGEQDEADEEPLPFDTRSPDSSSAPAKRVWDPVNGVAVEIIPQRGFNEAAIPSIDDQLHKALRSRSPADEPGEPAEVATDTDVLRTFAQASNLKRGRGNF